MNNIEFWNCIKEYDEHKNTKNEELLCDALVKEGLGQTIGGYFEVAEYPKYRKETNREMAKPSQSFHFFEYYIDDEKNNRSEKMPSYSKLKCPQLIMYIAEMAGLSREILEECRSFLRELEQKASLVGTKKGGGYLENVRYNDSSNCLTELIKRIHMKEIEGIIKESSTYDEIVQKVSAIR